MPRVLRAAFFALASGGCVLLVSPEHYGEHCRFAGETTQCGQCLLERCRAEIDAACLEHDALDALDRCADKHECESLKQRAASNQAARCATEACGAVCRSLAGTSRTACR